MATISDKAPADRGRSMEPFLVTTVTVTPISVSGADVECDITGAKATNNAIFLSSQSGYDITFNLVPGSGGTLAFDTQNPFASQNGRCPGPNGKPHPPCSVGNSPAPTADSFTISVAPTNGKAVSYYRLNFTGGLSCDPIIIHE